jgi:hypothetical protein
MASGSKINRELRVFKINTFIGKPSAPTSSVTARFHPPDAENSSAKVFDYPYQRQAYRLKMHSWQGYGLKKSERHQGGSRKERT